MPEVRKFLNKIKKISLNKTLLLIFPSLILGTIFALGFQIILAAWIGPTEPPPGGALTTGQYIDTSASSQTKLGSLTIGDSQNLSNLNVQGDIRTIQGDITSAGDLQVGGKTRGGFMGTSPQPAYFQDVWLDSPVTGGEGRWASIVEVPFTKNCQWIAGGDCSNVVLESDETEGDEKFYAVVKADFSGSRVYCCRPPKAPPPPPDEFPMAATISVSPSARCSAGSTYYKGVAVIKVTNATTGLPLNGATVYGFWSGATNLCENGTSPCVSSLTDSNGETTINSYEVDSATAYSAGYFRFTITDVRHAIGVKPSDLPKSADGIVVSGGLANTHVGSVTVTKTNIGNWKYVATVVVKIVNEADAAIPNAVVRGEWSDSYTGTTSPQTTNSSGEVTFTAPEIYCWNVIPQSNPKFTFTVTQVDPGACSPYHPEYNTPVCGCNYVSVTLCNYPLVFGWGFSGNQKYAWGENVGWNNFQPTYGGVLVWSDCLEGYVWAENVGWINLGDGTPSGAIDCGSGIKYTNTSATDFGVNHDRVTGNLSGYAWAENVGWINFRPASGGGAYLEKVDEVTLKFRGYAWGENVGWIHFDHTQISYIPITTQ